MKANKLEILLDLTGQGLVNYNGKEPHDRFYNDMKNNGKKTENGNFAKENIYRKEIVDRDGNKIKIVEPKKIISSNLLRKEILGDENSVNADVLTSNDRLRVAVLSQDKLIARGHTLLKQKVINVKRKSCLTVTDAEQTCDAVSWLETKTTSGSKDENSLFFKETCGKIEYQSRIFVDIKQLQFISIDDNYDRMALKETDVEGFINNINKRYGDNNAVLGNWGTTHLNVIGEQGIVLSEKVVSNIIREVIKSTLNIDIKRSGSYAKTSSIKINIGYPGDEINLLSKPKYVEINKMEDYDQLVQNIVFGIDFLPIEAPMIEKTEKSVKKK